MDASIFIRSYIKDFGWLKYCIRSITKYTTGFSEVVLVVPEDDHYALPKEIHHQVDKVFTTKPEHPNGYVDQQITKMRAHHYCDNNAIIYIDSDYVFTKPAKPIDFTIDGKLFIQKTSYEDLYNNYVKTHAKAPGNHPDEYPNVLKWQIATERALGFPVAYEYMRRAPAVIYAKTLIEIENDYPNMLQMDHDYKTFDFSEFNVMGAYAAKHHPERYTFLNTETDEDPERFIKQHWSWGGIKPDIKEYLSKVCE